MHIHNTWNILATSNSFQHLKITASKAVSYKNELKRSQKIHYCGYTIGKFRSCDKRVYHPRYLCEMRSNQWLICSDGKTMASSQTSKSLESVCVISILGATIKSMAKSFAYRFKRVINSLSLTSVSRKRKYRAYPSLSQTSRVRG